MIAGSRGSGWRRRNRALPVLMVLAACAPGGRAGPGGPGAAGVSAPVGGYAFPPAPPAPSGPLAAPVAAALARLTGPAQSGSSDPQALEVVAESGDSRLAWSLSDLLRLAPGGDHTALVAAFERLTGADPRSDPKFSENPWLSVTDHLIAWDLPAAPGYRERKADLFLRIEPAWAPFFADSDSAIDWRLVSWGGVRIDDRPEGATHPCLRGCIPALDDPALTDAEGGAWYAEDRVVFGLVVNGEALALPKNVMEVHEMANLSLGGRRLGIPYCTLCSSARAYFTDAVPAGVGPLLLRTSGLLSRSNKVMYDLRGGSVIDTFTGRALSGPLQDAGVELEETTVVSSSWGEWKEAHPDTRIVAQDGGVGRLYPDDPLRGRDDDGPIFPVGDVDPRLPVQAQVLGVIAPDGIPVAFPVDRAKAALAGGMPVGAKGVVVFADGDGLRARLRAGPELAAHQAFWFAWSQFHPGTFVWTPPVG